jgi:hypothetical protein
MGSPLWQCDQRELMAVMVELEARMRQDYASMLQLLSELDSRGGAGELGCSSTAAVLVHVLRISRKDALLRISQAEDLHGSQIPTGSAVPAQLPLTAEALAKGALEPGHVEAIQKALKGLEPGVRAYAERLLVDQANDDDPNALGRYASVVRDLVDPDGDPPDDRDPGRLSESSPATPGATAA